MRHGIVRSAGIPTDRLSTSFPIEFSERTVHGAAPLRSRPGLSSLSSFLPFSVSVFSARSASSDRTRAREAASSARRLAVAAVSELTGGCLTPAPVSDCSEAQSRRRCGRGEPSPGADVAGVSPSPGADVAGASPVPAQMWHVCAEGSRPTLGSSAQPIRRAKR